MSSESESSAPRELHVFISYRRKDATLHALMLYKELSQHYGHERVFYDIDSIAAGRDFVEVLDEALERADVLLVVIGPKWLDIRNDDDLRRLDDEDDYVRLEVERALGNTSVRVVPVLVNEAGMPSAHDLPHTLTALTRRNAVKLVDELWDATLEILVKRLERIRTELAPSSAAELLRDLHEEETIPLARLEGRQLGEWWGRAQAADASDPAAR